MTRWTDFVKEYSNKNNITYGCALSNPEMREQYYKKFPKQSKETIRKQKKAEEEEKEKRMARNVAINFKKKFVKPFLETKDKTQFALGLTKYKRFSQRVRDYIEEKMPSVHKIIIDNLNDKGKTQIKEKQEKAKAKLKAKEEKDKLKNKK
jgi:hypothetical protein